MNWLRKIWFARLRKIDLKILWPVCLENTSSLDKAKAVFAIHAFNDPAWTFLGEDVLISTIDNFTS